jgi:glycosyltransferase involved in cell wall biosynthesis
MISSPTIALCMIVKNEAPVIARCLASVRPFIATWVIVDTGSTDGTQEAVRNALQGLSGELYERPWVNFAVNRSQALQFAYRKADYVLIIDADETLSPEPGFVLPLLDRHAYYLPIESGEISYVQLRLLDNSLPWEYKGVLHEYPYSPEASTEGTLGGFKIIRYPDGARARDPLTYKRDALVLEAALLAEPENLRYIFYLAQSYRDAGDLENALRYYRRRAESGGWQEEVFYSLYQIAELRARRGDPYPAVLTAYLEAYSASPERAEPLYKIGLHYSRLKRYPLAYLFLAAAHAVEFPEETRLFLEKPVYSYLAALEYAVAAYYLGKDGEALDAYEAILAKRDLPAEIRALAESNHKMSLDRLGLS